MRIGNFRKAPADRKRYVVDYTDWLNDDETLTSVMATGNVVEDDFYVDGFVVDTGEKEIIFYVSGGIDGSEYAVVITVETSLQQTKQDYVTFKVTV
jgi:hypothetical protein